jgi:hypothetical protein
MVRVVLLSVALVAGLCLLPAALEAQAFNIDIDLPVAPPEQGGGVPSGAFGAAAGQTGYWNGIAGATVPGTLLDISGVPTLARISAATNTGAYPGTIGFGFPGNTGDHALLLNDGASVGTFVQGGWLRYTFTGLTPGIYDIFTYAVRTSGLAANTAVYVAQAVFAQTQIVTGPMPGNDFEYLVTHSIHRVDMTVSDHVDVFLERVPMHELGDVTGFQIVPVPEPSSIFTLAFGLAITTIWSRVGKQA